MGQEISEARFEKGDHETYLSRLRAETAFLETIFKNRSFSNADPVGGYELEAWIIDKDLNPAPINDQYIKQLADPMVSPELANFNVEFNFQPRRMHDKVFTLFHQELEALWHKAKATAQSMDSDLVMIGVLPTVRDSDLTIDNISLLNRYHALNEQVLRQRKNRPFELDIHGKDILAFPDFPYSRYKYTDHVSWEERFNHSRNESVGKQLAMTLDWESLD